MKKLVKTILLIGMMTATATAATISGVRPECEAYGLNGYCNKWKDGADTVVTSYRIIENKRLEYEKELSQLLNKKNLGLNIDSNKIQILRYQISSLDHISYIDFGLDCMGDKRQNGTTGLVGKYQNAKKSLNSKAISQGEFEASLLQIKNSNADLIKKCNKIVALTMIPSEEYAELCDEKSVSQGGNNSGICSENSSQNENGSKNSGNYNGAIQNVSNTIELGRQFKNFIKN